METAYEKRLRTVDVDDEVCDWLMQINEDRTSLGYIFVRFLRVCFNLLGASVGSDCLFKRIMLRYEDVDKSISDGCRCESVLNPQGKKNTNIRIKQLGGCLLFEKRPCFCQFLIEFGERAKWRISDRRLVCGLWW